MIAYVWSAKRVREAIEVSPSDHVPRNERDGCEGERIADFGPNVGLIVRTHWGPTPLGKVALPCMSADGAGEKR